MKTNLYLAILLLPLSSLVLKPVMYVRNNIKVQYLLILPPVSSVSVIEKGNIFKIDDELSKQAFKITSHNLKKCIPTSVKHEFLRLDSVKGSKIANFITKIGSGINSSRQAGKYDLPDSFVNMFDTSRVNFIFCTYSVGFIRSKANLVNPYQREEVIDFLTGLGGRPLQSSALMNCFIIDLRKKNILYFERDVSENSDPTEARFIKFQLTKIIRHCFI